MCPPTRLLEVCYCSDDDGAPIHNPGHGLFRRVCNFNGSGNDGRFPVVRAPFIFSNSQQHHLCIADFKNCRAFACIRSSGDAFIPPIDERDQLSSLAERDNNLASAHTLLPPPPEDDDGNEQFDPFDEDSRFEMHRVSMIDDSLQRLASIRGVKSVTVVELATGRVILSTLKDAAAAEIGAVAPSLLQRAASSSRDVAASLSNADGGSSSSKDDEMEMLCISTRTSELLLCADTILSGAAVIVEQSKGPFAPEPPPPKSPKRDDPESRYRRLLAGAGLPMSPGQFAGGEYDSEDERE